MARFLSPLGSSGLGPVGSVPTESSFPTAQRERSTGGLEEVRALRRQQGFKNKKVRAAHKAGRNGDRA